MEIRKRIRNLFVGLLVWWFPFRTVNIFLCSEDVENAGQSNFLEFDESILYVGVVGFVITISTIDDFLRKSTFKFASFFNAFVWALVLFHLISTFDWLMDLDEVHALKHSLNRFPYDQNALFSMAKSSNSKFGCLNALEYYERYIELVPNNCHMHHEYAMCFFNNAKYKQSIQPLKSTLDCSSWAHLDTVQTLAVAYWRSGTSDLSYPILIVERALLVFSKNNDWKQSHSTIRLYFTLAMLRHFSGNYESSLEMWKRLLPIASEWPAVSYYLALELEDFGDFSQAKFYYQRALTLDPTLQNASIRLKTLTQSKHLFNDFCFLNKTRYTKMPF